MIIWLNKIKILINYLILKIYKKYKQILFFLSDKIYKSIMKFLYINILFY